MKEIRDLKVGDCFYAYEKKDLSIAGCYQILADSVNYFNCCLLDKNGRGVIGGGMRVLKKSFETCEKSRLKCCMFSVFVPSHFYAQGCKNGSDNVYPICFEVFTDKIDFITEYESAYVEHIENLEKTLNKVKNL